MTEYKSEVKKIYAPQERVYERLSDLSFLSVIQQNVDNPVLREQLLQEAGDKIKPEQFDQVAERLRTLQITPDSVTGDASPLGNITLRIIERESPKTVKFALEGAPVQANMWIQLLSATDTECALRLTVKADLNFFIKQMIGGKLQKGVDGLAEMLTKIPY
ncbi:MAG: SRPBCC family protein [Bacteroidaceae bacterium]|nr:SRPBCC family protein [Bacteroidaceae bacterium]